MSSINKKEYEKLMQIVRAVPGQRLPSERALCESLNLSRGTVRQLLAEAEAKGFIQRRHGSGTYATDFSAESLKTVAILIDAEIKLENDPFFSSMTDSIQRQLQSQGRQCVLHRVSTDTEVIAPVNCDGMVLLGQSAAKILPAVQAMAIPTVGLFIPLAAPSKSRISIIKLDDFQGGRQAAEHLIGQKVTKILFAGRQEILASHLRRDGVLSVCRQEKICLEDVSAKLNYNGGVQAAGRIAELIGNEKMVGVVAANDWMGFGIHVGLLQQNTKNIRERIRMVSFDGLDICSEPSMKIESLKIPMDDISVDAVSELIRLSSNFAAVGRELVYGFVAPWQER